MSNPITGISSMATKALLADIVGAYRQRSGVRVIIESVGGVDAAKRVQAGEPFDVVVLARDAIDKLAAAGHVDGASTRDLVRSGVAVAVRAGAPRPAIDCEAAVKQAVLAAKSLSYSTGPSGVALAKLFEHWGIAGAVKGKMVQAPPGVPVGSLVAKGEVELGFQQLSELMFLPGIDVIGPLPAAIQIVTTFSASLGRAAAANETARAFIAFAASGDVAAIQRRHGMEPA